MKKTLFFGLIGISVLLLVNSCYYDDEEYLYPMTGCDTSNVSYQLTIAPVMQTRCNACHGTVNPSRHLPKEICFFWLRTISGESIQDTRTFLG